MCLDLEWVSSSVNVTVSDVFYVSGYLNQFFLKEVSLNIFNVHPQE